MGRAVGQEEPATRAGQAITIIAQNIDQAASCEGPICQDTGMPTFEVKTPVGANQIWMKRPDSRRRRRGDAAREAAAELGRFDHRREHRRQPRSGHADHPLRAVGRARHRDQADSERRRLREHQRAILAAGGAGSPWSRRPHARGRPQVRAARRVEGAGQGVQPRRGRRLHRRRSHLRLHAREGAALSHARRRQRRRAPARARGHHHGGSQPPRGRPHGFQRHAPRSSAARSAR